MDSNPQTAQNNPLASKCVLWNKPQGGAAKLHPIRIRTQTPKGTESNPLTSKCIYKEYTP